MSRGVLGAQIWDLKAGLARAVVNYQVQVDQHQTAVGAELLLRWNHPALGFVSPSDFITMAEESGEITGTNPDYQWIILPPQ